MWIVETTSGGWEGDTLKEIEKDMVEHYSDQPEASIPQIESMIWSGKKKEKEMCEKACNGFQGRIEETFADHCQDLEEEFRHQRQLSSTYYASVL